MAGAALPDFGRQLARALALDLPARDQVSRPGRAASVLLLFGRDRGGILHLLFVRRAETVDRHKGQIAFPGGRREPSDPDGGVFTALRETHEEVGIAADEVEPIGKLAELWTVTGYVVTPVTGILRRPIEDVKLVPQAAEVAEAFWLPVPALAHPATYRREYFLAGEDRHSTDVYRIGDRRIWGLTGSILKNMLDRLAAVPGE